MGRKRQHSEQIITALREAEVGLARGKSVKLISRELGITEQTYYRWRREYGGMKVSQARRLKELERENGREASVADLTLDKLIWRKRPRATSEPRAPATAWARRSHVGHSWPVSPSSGAGAPNPYRLAGRAGWLHFSWVHLPQIGGRVRMASPGLLSARGFVVSRPVLPRRRWTSLQRT